MIPITLGVAALAGGAAGYSSYYAVTKRRHRHDAAEANELLRDAQATAKSLIDEARRDEQERRRQLNATERQLLERQASIDSKFTELDRRQEQLRRQELELAQLRDELRAQRGKQQQALEEIAELSKTEARHRLLQATERDLKADLAALTEKLLAAAIAEADERARFIVASAMERVAAEQTAEHTVTTVALASDELKGRVIGKEGRNIQALERLTGVDFVIDETPGAIVLSSFDPVRRQVARMALEKLLADGRIHPARIEEVVERAQAELDREMRRAGEQAAKATGVIGLPNELVALLGQLKFRTSYSQNVLAHSVEMARLAGDIAREIGADRRTATTAALLHDIGKAVSHETEGSHHHIGAALAEQYGLEPAIVHAIKAHHDDVEATTPEALVVRTVDAISASRPGARGDNLEHYAKRMTELENLAQSFTGITKAYAVSAGRELRVIVSPERVDDLGALRLAREIAAKVESTLRFPGVIKVNVIRETRAVEFAK